MRSADRICRGRGTGVAVQQGGSRQAGGGEGDKERGRHRERSRAAAGAGAGAAATTAAATTTGDLRGVERGDRWRGKRCGRAGGGTTGNGKWRHGTANRCRSSRYCGRRRRRRRQRQSRRRGSERDLYSPRAGLPSRAHNPREVSERCPDQIFQTDNLIAFFIRTPYISWHLAEWQEFSV